MFDCITLSHYFSVENKHVSLCVALWKIVFRVTEHFFLTRFDNFRQVPCRFRKDVHLMHEFVRVLSALTGFNGPNHSYLMNLGILLQPCLQRHLCPHLLMVPGWT